MLRRFVKAAIAFTVVCFASFYPIPPVHAVDYEYPLPMLYKPENASQDPTLLPSNIQPADSRFRTFLDNADVVCIDDQEFAQKLLDNKIKDIKIEPATSGKTSVSVPGILNFALDSDKIVSNFEYTCTLRTLIDFYDNKNWTHFNTCCYVLGYGNAAQCSERLGLGSRNADGSYQPNILYNGSALSRLTSPEQQFNQLIKPRAKELLSCPPGQPGCEDDYSCKPNGPKSREIAGMVPDTYGEFKALSADTKDAITACMIPSTAASTAYLVIAPDTPYDSWSANENVAQYMLYKAQCLSGNQSADQDGRCQLQYAQLALYGLKGATDMSLKEMQILNTTEKSDAAIEEMNKDLYKPIDYAGVTTVTAALQAKINRYRPNCPAMKPSQFMGSYTPTSTNHSTFFTWLFHLLQPDKAGTDIPMRYRIYVIAPKETKMQDYIHSEGKAAIAGVYYPSEKTSLMQSIANPLPFEENSDEAVFKGPYTDMEPCPCPTGAAKPDGGVCYCPVEKEAVASYGPKPKNLGWLAGGALIQYLRLYTGQQNLLSPSHSDYFSDTCYFSQLARRIPLVGAIAGHLVSDALASNCPDPLNSTPKGPVCTLNRREDACSVCNTNKAGELLAEVGYPDPPPELMAVIESAGREFNVPGSIVLGVMFAEGGFQREACYGKWTSDIVANASCGGGEIPNCQSCNVSSEGALGPFQLIPSWIPNEVAGNPCNLYDAARITAFRLSRYRTGDAKWEDKCDGVNLHNNDGSGHRSTSCTDWAAEDVASGARAHRGVCDPAFQQHVMEFWKDYSCQ